MATKNITSADGFAAELKAGGSRFVLFYSAWCPFCTSFLPAWERRAKAADAGFQKINTDDLPELEDRFSVEVVPTVLFFRGGRLAARLDGVLGRGLSETDLDSFAAGCLSRGGKGK